MGRRYKKAGYRVQYRKKHKFGEIDFIAIRGSEKIAGEVKHSNKKRIVPSSVVKTIAIKARRIKAKPVLILTGKAEPSSEARRIARKLGVRIRKI